MASRPSRESGKTWHRAKGSKDQRLLESLNRTAIGCQNGAGRGSDMVGAPDVLKGTCPVRGALDGNLPLKDGKALSFDSINSWRILLEQSIRNCCYAMNTS
jgi:hypothetical protein